MIGTNGNKHLLIFIIRLVPILLFAFSCVSGERHDPPGSPVEDTSLISEAFTGISFPGKKEFNGTIISRDTMPLPKRIWAGMPRTVPYNDFSSVLNAPEKHSIHESLRIIIPGHDSIPGPRIYTAKIENYRFRHPPAQTIVPPKMKFGAEGYTKHYSKDQGFGGGASHKTIQDKEGNLWHIDHDLLKFNGSHMFRFTHLINDKNETIHLSLHDIISDSKGNLWFIRGSHIVPTNRIIRYDGNRCEAITAVDSTGLELTWRYTCLFEDHFGNIWIGNMFNGLMKYRPPDPENPNGTFLHFTKECGLPGEQITCITGSHDGSMWIGTRDSGIYHYQQPSGEFPNGRFIHYSVSNGLNTNHVTALAETADGRVWVGTYNGGINILEGSSISFLTVNEGLSSNVINCLLEDKSHDIWIAIHGGGVCRLEPNKSSQESGRLTAFNTNNLLFGNYITSVLQDNLGRMWFGGFGGSLTMFDFHSFHHINSLSGMDIEFVTSPVEDKDGNIWFGDDRGGGICKFDGSNFHYFARDQGLPCDSIASMIYGSDDNIWIATSGGGLCSFDGVWFTHYTAQNGISSNNTTCILEDSRKNIWIGTKDNGICKITNNEIVQYNKTNGLCDNFIYCLFEDREHNIWIGSEAGGVDKFDGRHITNLNKDNGLQHNQVVAVLEDSRGDFWFGVSFKGFVRYREKAQPAGRFEVISGTGYLGERRSGNNYRILEGYGGVSFMMEDNAGRMWLADRGGLNLVSIPDTGNLYNITPQNFQTYDGKSGDNSVFASCLLTKENRFCWGGDNCLSYLDLNSFKPPSGIPEVKITGLDLEQSHVDFRQLQSRIRSDQEINTGPNNNINLNKVRFDRVFPHSNLPENLILPYYLNQLTFHFTAIDWEAPHKLLYRYKLEGSDKTWRNITNETSVTYTNLRQGKYTLMVKALGAGQVWSEADEYKFSILPPWWETVWAYLLYSMIIISLVLVWRRYDLRRRKLAEELKLEKVRAEKLKEVDKMKTDFFANISHEFRTPLTLILGPLQNLIRKSDDFEQKNQLTMMHRNARRLHRLINQLLNLTMLEAGKMKLSAAEENIVSLTRIYVQAFESYARQKNIDLSFHSVKDEIIIHADRDKIEKILSNLLSNAFKFTPEGGRISVKISIAGETRVVAADSPEHEENRSHSFSHVAITVSDSGCGIPEEKLKHVFERFYSAHENDCKNGHGSGIGLALTKELVDLHHGKIKAESAPGKGAAFTILLPAGKAHLKPDEISGEKKPDLPSQEKLREAVSGLKDENCEESGSYGSSFQVKDKNKTQTDYNDQAQVLIVEDNADLRNYIRGMLDSAYLVDEAQNGEQGLEKAIETVPDLIISDIMMPKMNGVELCNRIKSDERTCHIPLILLTARASLESKIQGLDTGAEDFITKPFEQEELIVRVRNLITQRNRLREFYIKELTPKKWTLDSAEIKESEITEAVSVNKRFLEKAKNLTFKQMSDPDFGVEELAGEIGLSRAQLHRKLKALVGQNPSEFIRTLRLHRAAELLMKGKGNVSEIAWDVGFNNPTYFSSCFSKQFGMSPKEFIRKNQ
ncbi:MAG: response regulator [Bacteroidales bacterium]|nr:response regulator [Bacteroidales bacterium]